MYSYIQYGGDDTKCVVCTTIQPLTHRPYGYRMSCLCRRFYMYFCLRQQWHSPVSTWEGWRSHVTQQSEPRYWHKADGVPVSLPGNRQGTISQSDGRTCYLSLLLSSKEDWCMMITQTMRICTYLWLWSFTPPLYSISAATVSGITRESWPAANDSLASQWALCCVCAACGIPYLFPHVARP